MGRRFLSFPRGAFRYVTKKQTMAVSTKLNRPWHGLLCTCPWSACAFISKQHPRTMRATAWSTPTWHFQTPPLRNQRALQTAKKMPATWLPTFCAHRLALKRDVACSVTCQTRSSPAPQNTSKTCKIRACTGTIMKPLLLIPWHMLSVSQRPTLATPRCVAPLHTLNVTRASHSAYDSP